jgi:hypothetical protein
MNDIYEHKAKKYKYKYLELKAEYFGGENDKKFRIGLSRFLFPSYFATKDKNKSVEENKKAFDRKIIECTDIKKNEDINGFIFENNIKGSYNKLQNDRIKEIQDLESNEYTKPQYNIYEFFKDGCPNSQTLITKLDNEKKERERIIKQQHDHDNNPVVIAQRAEQQAREKEKLIAQRKNDELERLQKYGPPGVSETRAAYIQRGQ